MWAWAVSERGQAIVDLASASFSAAAILIAVGVALVEQRRFHAERQRELRRDREGEDKRRQDAAAARAKFLRLAIGLIEKAEAQLSSEIDRMETLGSYVEWTEINGVPHLMRPFLDSLRALQAIQQDDPDVVLALSKAVRALQELVSGLKNVAPPTTTALHHSRPRLEDLAKHRRELREYLQTLEPLLPA